MLWFTTVQVKLGVVNWIPWKVNRFIVNGLWYVLIWQEHQHAKVDSCVTWLSQQAMCGPNRFQIRFLEDLSLELYAHAGKNVSESSVLNMLTTSAFDYEPNTRYCTNSALVTSCHWNSDWKVSFSQMQTVRFLHHFLCGYFFSLLVSVCQQCLQCFWHCWLGIRKSIRTVKKLSDGVLAWLFVWNEMQMICIVWMVLDALSYQMAVW